MLSAQKIVAKKIVAKKKGAKRTSLGRSLEATPTLSRWLVL
jgi:hypothetical protein